MRLSISEIIKGTVELTDKTKKVEFLQKHNSVPLRTVLKYTYDKKVEFLLPDVRPPWKKNGLVDVGGMLYTEARRLKIFTKGGPYDGKLKQLKMEVLFINLLESIDDNDAEIVANMLEKKPIKGLPVSVIEAAFPNIFEENL